MLRYLFILKNKKILVYWSRIYFNIGKRRDRNWSNSK